MQQGELIADRLGFPLINFVIRNVVINLPQYQMSHLTQG